MLIHVVNSNPKGMDDILKVEMAEAIAGAKQA